MVKSAVQALHGVVRCPAGLRARYTASAVDRMQALPHRRAARVVVLDAQGRILLFRHAGCHGCSFWATPGGGLEGGETFEQAACREASEELGVTGISVRLLWEGTNDFLHVDHPVRQHERYFLMEGTGHSLLAGVQSIHQQEGILEARWWTRAELEVTTEPVFPEDLATQLSRISTS